MVVPNRKKVVMEKNLHLFKEREISWLSFNERVLQEADDDSVPPIERLKFLGIFSSNLDEFFRVRVAVLKRMTRMSNRYTKMVGKKPEEVLGEIQRVVIAQNRRFEKIYEAVLKQLAKHNIFIINEKQLTESQGEIVKRVFKKEVQPTLVPIMVDGIREFPYLKDKSIYLAVVLRHKKSKTKNSYALIEVPTGLSRFVVLPETNGKQYIILLDDVIRYCLNDIFFIYEYEEISAYTVKMTRDAELDMDNDAVVSYIEKLSKSVKQRQKGSPVRFIYDAEMPEDFLSYFFKRLHLSKKDNAIAGGRYHNFKDFIRFPNVGGQELRYNSVEPLSHRDLPHGVSLFSQIRKKDILLHYPYQSFDHILDLLREAAIDPDVKSIKMTLYRVAGKSNVVNALINAVKNGKSVTVVMELQARFDEEANIYWSNKLVEEGARVIHGFRSTEADPRENQYKVHSKLCLITRKEGRKTVLYANISTGNFNEDTSRLYCDDSLLTANEEITDEVSKIFDSFEDHVKLSKTRYKHLLVSPYNMRARLEKMIWTEIENHLEGKPSWIILKVNNLVDKDMVALLNEAVRVGVSTRLIIRGTCSLVPSSHHENGHFQAISIVDKYLEHSRVYAFCNNLDPKFYITSADMMTRNLDQRIEVACPIYDRDLQKELKQMLDIQLHDNVKARLLDRDQSNRYRKATSGAEPIRSQEAIRTYLTSLK